MVSMIDIHILDLQGNSYDINSIRRDGNDALLLIIKKSDEDYVSDEKVELENLIGNWR